MLLGPPSFTAWPCRRELGSFTPPRDPLLPPLDKRSSSRLTRARTPPVELAVLATPPLPAPPLLRAPAPLLVLAPL